MVMRFQLSSECESTNDKARMARVQMGTELWACDLENGPLRQFADSNGKGEFGSREKNNNRKSSTVICPS